MNHTAGGGVSPNAEVSNNEKKKQSIIDGKATLGIELGSTRIKAVLIDEEAAPIASGSFEWENRLEDGVWTYHLDDVWTGLQASFKELSDEVSKQYGVALSKVEAIGISAMMHGYLVFDKENKQLVPFRTWRNTFTEEAADKLTDLFQFNIPQRWNIAHLYQAILNKESHVKDIALLTTLAGYVHWQLTGEKILGVGEASGMFPIDSNINSYNPVMVKKFDTLIAAEDFGWKLEEILPKVQNAGTQAGSLTSEGAKLLDPSGQLQAGIPMCPPEGDASTGMVATNSVAERTGNVSAGTSVFAMGVLEKELSKVYKEIDMITTPSGRPVAMVHCNNFTSDLDAWVKMFGEITDAFNANVDKSDLYGVLYNRALEGDKDCGGLLAYNYLSGEHMTGFEEGRPLFARRPDSRFNLANFMRTLLFSAMATIKIGMDILTEKEHVRLEQLLGHGGLFKTKGVGQRLMAAAMNIPVVVMESAGEGGAWGIALLAAYMARKADNESLENYLDQKVFSKNAGTRVEPDAEDVKGFNVFIERFKAGFPIERAAVESLK